MTLFSHNDEKAISEYVESQLGKGEKVDRAEKVTTKQLHDTTYDVWDVHSNSGRWWVFTNPTNYYDQSRFPSVDETFTFHLGLWMRISAQRSAGEAEHGIADARQAYRRLHQAKAALPFAEEADEFQSIGMRCREALLAFIAAWADPALVPDGSEVPQGANFKGWIESLLASGLDGSSNSATRKAVRGVAFAAWDHASWLTHGSNADQRHAVIGLRLTSGALDLMTATFHAMERTPPYRCPTCGSYKVHEYQIVDHGHDEAYDVAECEACGWKG